jgi:8-oxo-dGTP pyrophosphatase MutT (NUDIX family)/phosphohistidine phosphatase SixA
VGQASRAEGAALAEELKRGPIQAAGGVVWRVNSGENGAEVEVAIIHRPRYDDWSIPKGKLAPGESAIEGGLREVWEETGYRVQAGHSLGEIRYLKKSGGHTREKVVHFWAMRATGGSFSPSREVDELRWMKLDEARELVTRATDIEVLERFARRPAMTGLVLLVRHASAGSSGKWDGEDRLRPLDETGEEQADELVRLLSRFGVEAIVSADYTRCIETMQPLSEAIGVPIETDPLLSDDGFPGHEEQAAELLRNLGRPGSGAVACSQGDVIPELVQRLAADDGVEIEEPSRLKKAGVWALSFDDHRLVAADRFPPPKLS